MTSRVIIKNIPKYYVEQQLKTFVESRASLMVTDVRIPKTSQGVSRQIAFIGVQNTEAAENLIKILNRSFLDTCKLNVSYAYAPGSNQIPRPWSKHTAGSFANVALTEKRQKRKAQKELNKEKVKEAKTTEKISATSQDVADLEEFLKIESKRKGHNTWCDTGAMNKKNIVVTTKNVTPTKAGISSVRQHTEFLSDDEAENNSLVKSKTTTASLVDLDKIFADGLNQETVENTRHLDHDEGTDNKSALSSTDEKPLEWLKQKSEAEKQLHDQDKKFVEDSELLGDTGRILVLNIPYFTKENDLKEYFSTCGEVCETHICKLDDRITSKGRGFITYAFPEHAVRAVSELDNTIFQGRLIRVKPALPPKEKVKSDKVQGFQAQSSYKAKLEEKRKKEAGNVESWNLLYVSGNAAMDAAANELSISKSELFENSESAAAKVAIAETLVVKQSKEWLKNNGINMACFERQGTSLLASRAVDLKSEAARSKDCILVKHLPANVTDADIYQLFSKCGPLVRYCLAPSNTIAIVQYLEDRHAHKAFLKLAYTKFKNYPLYLEMAPVDLFLTEKPTTMITGYNNSAETSNNVLKATQLSETDLIKQTLNAEDLEIQRVSLFVKNLNFETTEETLTCAFSSAPGFIKATIMHKKKGRSLKNETNEAGIILLSMGYGFLEFESMSTAVAALKRFQHMNIDDHAIELKISERVKNPEKTRQTTPAITQDDLPAIDLSKLTNKLTVRNLAFQATKKDLKTLFNAFGNVTAVRIPKKIDGTSRGYGFVEFLSRSEALSAVEALQHTHLYGRKLIIEPADTTDTSVEAARAKQIQTEIAASRATISQKKKGLKNLV